ncbi:DNA-processing protein DprA [Amaricoccus solimangrovi]|uniref:DNA-protecting protein DprA n=1 Tax=Amaricoccus solimangrovi TaxID=2589815 RepID=A0A501WKA8_9RHOB|nr:DNA-processing protein DprA [Amaricoccus solimangrovi]TPE48820.1 DNA-protecting protein DprA [Amaricoccus solimangrovi]
MTEDPEGPAGPEPPASREELIDWLRLARSRRVGPVTFLRLTREHGSAARALRALPGLASEAGLRDYAPFPREAAEAELRAGAALGARPLALGAADYPPRLARIPDPPPLVWALGDPALAARPAVALVGARNASALGCRMAARLARDLGAAGFVVVSGLARGIDAAAHRAALDGGTVAIQAGGVDEVYPPENAELAAAIGAGGLRLSEMPMGHPPRTRDFPRRNRIISGLALGVVVVEGALRSGSLITARAALDQGREVMAVPGNPLDARAAGCNALIRDGALLVRDAGDVLEALAPAAARRGVIRVPRPAPAAPPPEGGELGSRLLALLGPTPIAEDALIRDLGGRAAEVAAALLDLELAGHVLRHPGGGVGLAPGAG